ncbi:Uncharacterised protein [Mycobacteroides abscessus subsp. abscessus]|nr:Uncharacterised protein [Mycobacteroides abscessus subsp. abscessus]
MVRVILHRLRGFQRFARVLAGQVVCQDAVIMLRCIQPDFKLGISRNQLIPHLSGAAGHPLLHSQAYSLLFALQRLIAGNDAQLDITVGPLSHFHGTHRQAGFPRHHGCDCHQRNAEQHHSNARVQEDDPTALNPDEVPEQEDADTAEHTPLALPSDGVATLQFGCFLHDSSYTASIFVVSGKCQPLGSTIGARAFIRVSVTGMEVGIPAAMAPAAASATVLIR